MSVKLTVQDVGNLYEVKGSYQTYYSNTGPSALQQCRAASPKSIFPLPQFHQQQEEAPEHGSRPQLDQPIPC